MTISLAPFVHHVQSELLYIGNDIMFGGCWSLWETVSDFAISLIRLKLKKVLDRCVGILVYHTSIKNIFEIKIRPTNKVQLGQPLASALKNSSNG
jgi:hypothetical protein